MRFAPYDSACYWVSRKIIGLRIEGKFHLARLLRDVDDVLCPERDRKVDLQFLNLLVNWSIFKRAASMRRF